MTANQATNRIILIGLCIALSRGLFAQELEVFERNDYLDPQLRLRSTANGSEQAPLLASFAFFGVSDNYQFRNTFSKETVGFLRSTTHFYDSWFQSNLKLTAFYAPEENSVVPRWKGRFEVGAYVPLARIDGPPARILLAWNVMDLPDGTVNELGMFFDAFQLVGGGLPWYGGVFASMDLSNRGSYMGVVVHGLIHRWRNGLALRWDCEYGIGDGDLDKSVLQARITGEVPVSFVSSRLHVVGSGAYRPGAADIPSDPRSDKWNLEFGIFLSTRFLSNWF